MPWIVLEHWIAREPLAEGVHVSAVEVAFEGLRAMISTGRLGAGQRFPVEARLCTELGVSRSSLREAVRMLAALGVVETRQGSGTYVSRLRAADIVGSLTLTVGLLPWRGCSRSTSCGESSRVTRPPGPPPDGRTPWCRSWTTC